VNYTKKVFPLQKSTTTQSEGSIALLSAAWLFIMLIHEICILVLKVLDQYRFALRFKSRKLNS